MHRSSLVALLFATAGLVSCRQQEPQPPVESNLAEPVNAGAPQPLPQQEIDRASLLAAVAEVSSATASGGQVPESARSLDGRQFEFRIRFGCRGPSTNLRERWLGWSIDPADRRIRVRALPTISTEDALVAGISGGDHEAVEGFWIPRPWLLQPVCPAGAAVQAAQPGGQARDQRSAPQLQSTGSGQAAQAPVQDERGEPVPASPRIGIAQFFTENDPRSRRRDARAYEASHTLEEGEAISSQGYNLVLSGRLRALPGRGVIQCVPRGADAAPECIVSAEFLRVWIEQPDTRAVLAEWSS